MSLSQDFLQLRFDGPLFTLYAWPHVLLSDFSVAFGEPEYRNALCAQIGETVAQASLEEGDALTIELESGDCDWALVAGRRYWMGRSRELLSETGECELRCSRSFSRMA